MRRHVIAPSVAWADELRAEQGLPPIGQHVTPAPFATPTSPRLFAAGADQEYVASQVGHEDFTTTNRIYRYVLRRTARGQIGERSCTATMQALTPSSDETVTVQSLGLR